MEFGKYKITLSIGFYGTDQEDEIDLEEYYDREEWEEMSEEKQEEEFRGLQEEVLGQRIEYGYKFLGE